MEDITLMILGLLTNWNFECRYFIRIIKGSMLDFLAWIITKDA